MKASRMKASRMRASTVLFTTVIACTLLARAAHAKDTEYISRHPLSARTFCNTNSPHVHAFEPHDLRLYRKIEGQYYFVGDPVPFGFTGPKVVYVGQHPISDLLADISVPLFCYLKGRHSHWYEPVAALWFERREGAFVFVGAYDPIFYGHRPEYLAINDAYAPPAPPAMARSVRAKNRARRR